MQLHLLNKSWPLSQKYMGLYVIRLNVLFLWICHLCLTSLKEWNFMSDLLNFPKQRKELTFLAWQPCHTLILWGYPKYRCYSFFLVFLVGLIVKLSLWTNSPWVGKGPSCQSLGGGCCKSVVPSVSHALGESVHWSCLPLVFHVKFL